MPTPIESVLLVCTPIESVLLVCTGTYGVQADMERRLDKAAYGTAETRVRKRVRHTIPLSENIFYSKGTRRPSPTLSPTDPVSRGLQGTTHTLVRPHASCMHDSSGSGCIARAQGGYAACR